MTILNQRRKRRTPGVVKWALALAILAGIVYFFYWLGGEKPLARIEQPVELSGTNPG